MSGGSERERLARALFIAELRREYLGMTGVPQRPHEQEFVDSLPERWERASGTDAASEEWARMAVRRAYYFADAALAHVAGEREKEWRAQKERLCALLTRKDTEIAEMTETAVEREGTIQRDRAERARLVAALREVLAYFPSLETHDCPPELEAIRGTGFHGQSPRIADLRRWTALLTPPAADDPAFRSLGPVDGAFNDPAAATPDDEIDQVWAHTIEECALIAEAHGAASAAEAIRAKLVANKRAATPDATQKARKMLGETTPGSRPQWRSPDLWRFVSDLRAVLTPPDATGGGA